jgi:uncharacterized protein YqcC (DUF446 family)
MLRGLQFWQKNQPKSHALLLHAGTADETVSDTMGILPWTEVMNL